MRKVIDGMLCDTTTAKQVGSVIVDAEVQTLYRTKSGGFFIHYSSAKGERIEETTITGAEFWCEDHGFTLTEYGMELIAVRLPKHTLDKIDAVRGKYNRSEYIRQLIEKSL